MAKLKGSILVVDDEPAMRLLVTSILGDEGHDVTAAATGEEALQLIERHHYHLIISDLKMPGMSGVDLLERVKQEDPETAVILLTAFGTVEGAVEAMRKGAVHYLLKPLANPDELRLAVRRVLAEQRVADDWTASCSGMRRGRSPARSPSAAAGSSWPTRGRSFSTRWAK